MTIQYYKFEVDDVDDLPDEVRKMITEGDRIRRKQTIYNAVWRILAFAIGMVVGFSQGVMI